MEGDPEVVSRPSPTEAMMGLMVQEPLGEVSPKITCPTVRELSRVTVTVPTMLSVLKSAVKSPPEATMLLNQLEVVPQVPLATLVQVPLSAWTLAASRGMARRAARASGPAKARIFRT